MGQPYRITPCRSTSLMGYRCNMENRNKYGSLSIVRKADNLYGRFEAFLFRCDCGAEKVIAASNVFSGKVKSCGCLRRHVSSTIRKTHGMSRTKPHWAWKHMKSRCLNASNKDYHKYGGAGITVCNEWKDSFEKFYEDMGDPPSSKHSVDRINNAIGYEPGNCRWATSSQQNRNRSCARYLTAFGETKLLIEWSTDIRCRTSCSNLGQRIRKGWANEAAISTQTQGTYS
jgi:hypothetical protein